MGGGPCWAPIPAPGPRSHPEFPLPSHLHAVGLPGPRLTVGENADTVASEAGQHSGLQLPEDLGALGEGS